MRNPVVAMRYNLFPARREDPSPAPDSVMTCEPFTVVEPNLQRQPKNSGKSRGALGGNPFRLIIPGRMCTDTTTADETRAAHVLRS